MNRYHTTIDTGEGIEDGIMRVEPFGYWVLYRDAQDEIEAAYQRGLEAAHTNLKLALPELQPKADGTRTNQLLNELYHDRARLERVVRDAVELCLTAMELEETERDDSEYVLGLLQQFVDTHEE